MLLDYSIRYSRRIAMQSVVAGIGMSIVDMVAATLGFITPVQGAIIKEFTDVTVTLNALRVLWIRPQIGLVARS